MNSREIDELLDQGKILVAPNQRLYIEAKENGNNNIHFNHLQATKIMCSRLLPKMKRSVARYVAGSVAIFSFVFFRQNSRVVISKKLDKTISQGEIARDLRNLGTKSRGYEAFHNPCVGEEQNTKTAVPFSAERQLLCSLSPGSRADAMNGTETSRLMALKFGVKLINHEKSLPR